VIRVLVVDDSALMRHVLRDLVAEGPGMQVAGEASNGLAGCEQNLALKPDLIIMDIDMPIMDGVSATARIMAERPVPIFIFSSSADSPLGFQALSAGACEVLRKPEIDTLNDPAFKASFFQKIRELAAPGNQKGSLASNARKAPGAVDHSEVRAVVIGASTGGPVAVRQVLGALPADFPVGIALVQHLEDGFDEGYAKWLDEVCPLNVRLAGPDSGPLQAGSVLVGPVNRHLALRSGKLVLDDGPKVQNQKPAVDVLFRTAAETYGPGLIGVLLTGMGRDGAQGCRDILDRGGYTLVQDQASCAIFGMPRAAIELGAASEITPLANIAGRLVTLTRKTRQGGS